MNKRLLMILTIFVALTFLFPVKVLAADLSDDKVVFGGTFTLESGDILNGDLLVIGGSATLEVSSQVNGSVVLVGGNSDIKGDVLGDIVGIGGLIGLDDHAVVHGDIVILGAHLDKMAGAQVDGEIVYAPTNLLSIRIPNEMSLPNFQFGFTPIFNMIWFVFRIFIWAAIAMLVAIFFPEQTKTIGETAALQPAIAGGLGLLTVLIAPPILVILGITIIFLPVSVLAFMILIIAWASGIVAIGYEAGKRLSLLLNQDWNTAISAGIGTFILVFVMNGVLELVPCVGWVLPGLVVIVGLGAVFISRFGTQIYQGYSLTKPEVDNQISEPPINPESSS